jgi:hypothetical protein
MRSIIIKYLNTNRLINQSSFQISNSLFANLLFASTMFSKTIVIYITRPETVILQVRARFVIRGVSRGSTSASNFFFGTLFCTNDDAYDGSCIT